MSSAIASENAKPALIETPHPRAEYEDFLYREAALLDEWRLDEWFDLFADGATYEVPTTGAAVDAESARDLFYIADDYVRLRHRVNRLKKKEAHSEWPRSTGARLISNVRVVEATSDGVDVRSVFVTFRAKNDKTDCFFGHHKYLFRTVSGKIKIAAKRTFLDMSSLRPHGRVSIIV